MRPTIRKPAVEAAGAVDAENAPPAPWKTAKNAVSHSYHRPLLSTLGTQTVLPMFPVNSVTYVPGCTHLFGAFRPRCFEKNAAARVIDSSNHSSKFQNACGAFGNKLISTGYADSARIVLPNEVNVNVYCAIVFAMK